MVSAIDGGGDASDPDKRPSGPASVEPSPGPSADRPRVLVVDADPATQSLLEEWLTENGCQVQSRRSEDNARPAQCCQDSPVNGFDLALVDVPFPRQGLAQLERVALAHPGTPIVAMSSTFFASVECTGAVARMLGVAGVLPKPLRREALISALRTLLKRR